MRHYLDEPPTKTELTEVLNRLGLEPWHITRTGEPVAKEIGVPDFSRDEENHARWIQALIEHPILSSAKPDDGTWSGKHDFPEQNRAGTESCRSLQVRRRQPAPGQ